MQSVRNRYTAPAVVGVYVSVFMAITPVRACDNDPRYTPVNVASIRGGFVFRKTLSLTLPMPMLINYSLTNVRRLQLHALLRSLIHPKRPAPNSIEFARVHHAKSQIKMFSHQKITISRF